MYKIVEGRMMNHDGESYGQVLINNMGDIVNVGCGLGTPTLLLSDSEVMYPGFIDLHVHARDDITGQQKYKEDFMTASLAAIQGGVVCFADMPNNIVAPVDRRSYADKMDVGACSKVPVLFYAGIGPSTNPMDVFPTDREVPYKAFMGPSVGDLFFESGEQLEEAIARYEGRFVTFHCESPDLLRQCESNDTHESRRPRETEIEAVEVALRLIEQYDLQGNIAHVSTSDSVDLISEARANGVNVACEVTPHHLYFDDSMLTDDNRLWLQMNPPLRNPKDRVALINALRDGRIDCLATDHAPHIVDEKLGGTSGVPNLDTYGAFTTWLMTEHGFTAQDILRVCSYNPSEVVNQFIQRQYGKIEEGYAGSLTIIDTETPWKVLRRDLQTKCGWSPFEGVEFFGSVSHTVVKGEIYSFFE